MMLTRLPALRLPILLLILGSLTLSGCITYSGPAEPVVSYTVEVADPNDPSQVYSAEITYFIRDTTQNAPGSGSGGDYFGPEFVSHTVVTRPDGSQFVLNVPPGQITVGSDGSLFMSSSDRGFQTYDEIVVATTSFLVEAIGRDLRGELETRLDNTSNSLHFDHMVANVDAITDISMFDIDLLF